MLSQSQLLSTSVSRTTSFPLDVADASHLHAPDSTGPAIAVTRPSLVAASVDDIALGLLRKRFQEESRDRSSSLSVDGFLRSNNLENTASRSAQNSPKLRRRDSFKVKKLKIFKSTSSGLADGYESLNTDFNDDAKRYSRERVTSLNLTRTNSFTASTPPSPCRYRAMTFSPAKNRVMQYDSSSDEGEGPLSSDHSPTGESNLDFGSGTRNKLSHVSCIVL